jgi:hypothetical protein
MATAGQLGQARSSSQSWLARPTRAATGSELRTRTPGRGQPQGNIGAGFTEPENGDGEAGGLAFHPGVSVRPSTSAGPGVSAGPEGVGWPGRVGRAGGCWLARACRPAEWHECGSCRLVFRPHAWPLACSASDYGMGGQSPGEAQPGAPALHSSMRLPPGSHARPGSSARRAALRARNVPRAPRPKGLIPHRVACRASTADLAGPARGSSGGRRARARGAPAARARSGRAITPWQRPRLEPLDRERLAYPTR